MLSVLHATGQVLSTRVPRRRLTAVPQVVTLIAGKKRRSLLIAETTVKCLWQEVSTLRQRRQNSF